MTRPLLGIEPWTSRTWIKQSTTRLSRCFINGVFQFKQCFKTSFFCCCCVRPLSVMCGHSVFSFPPLRSMTSDFKGFWSQIECITFSCPILLLERIFKTSNIQWMLQCWNDNCVVLIININIKVIGRLKNLWKSFVNTSY